MKRQIEIGLNLAFWIISIWVIFQLISFNFHEVDVKIIDGEEIISETVFDLSNWFYFGLVLKVILFYAIIFFIVPRFFLKKKYIYFVVIILGSLSLFIAWEFIPIQISCGGIHPLYQSSSLTSSIFYTSVAVVYGIIRNQLIKDSQAQRLQNEKLHTELKLLRSQINPHFLFNALNNLLALSEKSGSKTVSEGISQLSDLLRFLIYDAQTNLVPLQKEIEFIESYIALQELRYAKHDEIDVTLETYGIDSTQKIAPALLIPFVENAFKHGIKYDAPSFVTINIHIEKNRLSFKISNSIHFQDKSKRDERYSGVGLKNVKKRLELMYDKKYDLNIKERENVFLVVLQLEMLYD